MTKYPNKVLTKALEQHITEQTPLRCQRYAWEPLAIEVMPDQVPRFVSAPPTTAPVTITQTLKSILAVSVFKAFPTLKRQRFWGSGLGSEGCDDGSAGTVSAATIARYIANQKSKPE